MRVDDPVWAELEEVRGKERALRRLLESLEEELDDERSEVQRLQARLDAARPAIEHEPGECTDTEADREPPAC